ncbi:glycoside hydrolase family 95 protein [Propionibacterium freudenreichii]|uniref:glycoside hydrolase family 95 protein n=1 Tax=Propionibacterium freudenreichii TaxID=1744 RepID=UPI002551A774|nr:glycoside hydrolase family 95 protein [Propionibacterium freudenreichii]MDK9592085.1 glycoside hydrolase family 95 protein [Propionibacterium freudenreichii]
MDRYRIEVARPAASPADAFLLGNGNLGVAVHGAPGTETLDLGLDTLWSGGPLHATPRRAPGLVEALRAAIVAGNSPRTEQLARAMQHPVPPTPALQQDGRRDSPQPLGSLRWGYAPDVADAPHGYSRVLDLSRAIATTRFGTGRRGTGQLDCFVSAPDHVLLADWMGAAHELVAPEFDCPHPCERQLRRRGGRIWLTVAGRAPVEAPADPSYARRATAVHYGTDAPDGEGRVPAGMAFALVVAVEATASGSRLVAAARDGFLGWQTNPIGDPGPLVRAARQQVDAALAMDSELLARRHVADHAALFDRVDLDLGAGDGAARDELAFHLGRSLLIASTRRTSSMPTSGSLWATTRSADTGDALERSGGGLAPLALDVVGLGELMDPVEQAAGELVTAGRATAANSYGFAGACVHGTPDIWRHGAPGEGPTDQANWPSALLGLIAPLYRHAAHGGDRGAALEAHRAAVEFVLDQLINGPDGALLPCPSTLPGSLCLGPDGRLAGVGAGSSFDLSLVRQSLEHYVELVGARPGSADAAMVARAHAALAGLAPLPVRAGRLRDWPRGRRPADGGAGLLRSLHGVFRARASRGAAIPSSSMPPAARSSPGRDPTGTGRGARDWCAGWAWPPACAFPTRPPPCWTSWWVGAVRRPYSPCVMPGPTPMPGPVPMRGPGHVARCPRRWLCPGRWSSCWCRWPTGWWRSCRPFRRDGRMGGWPVCGCPATTRLR